MRTIRVRATRREAKALIRRAVAAATGKVPDPSGLARGVPLTMGLVALSLIQENFVTLSRGGTGADGARWAPLKAATLRRRRQRGKDAEILRDTGRMFNSFSPGLSVRASDGEVFVGTNVFYARFQHEGTRTIPARRLWPEPAQWPASWWRQMADAGRQALAALIVRVLGG